MSESGKANVILKNLKSKNIAIFLIGIFLVSLFSGFFSVNFFRSKSLFGDHIFLLITAKTFIDWGSFFSNNSLGYPGKFTWLGFPYSDYSERLLLFIAAVISRNVVVATNLYYLLIVLLIFSSSYFVIFKYTKNSYFSLFGSLMFVLTPYMEVRSTGHDLLAAYYCVPWAFYLLYEIFLVRPEPVKLWDFKFFFRIPIMISLVIIASSGVYYTAFSGMLLLASGFFLSVLRKRLKYAYLGFQSTAITFVLLLICFSPFLLYFSHWNIHPPARSFTEQPLVGARISDNLWTLGNYFKNPFLASYAAWRSSPAQSPEGYDFWPGILLSIFAIGIIFFIPYFSMKHLSKENESKGDFLSHEILITLSSYTVLLLLTAAPYGLGLVFNFLINPNIRNYNRLSPFFAFAAILLLSLFLKTSFSALRSFSRFVPVFMGVFFLLNCYPVFGFMSRTQSQLLQDNDYALEMKSIRATLSVIHKAHLRRIYQGPEIFWPEAPRIQKFDSYNHALLYIFDRNKSKTQWSYGLMSNIPEYRLLSMIESERKRKDSLVQLSCLGFDGVVLEKRGYSEKALQDWVNGLQEFAGSALIYSDLLRMVFSLPAVPNSGCQKQELFPQEKWLSVKKGGDGSPLMLRGWGDGEGWGTWGIGSSQTLFIPVISEAYSSITIAIDARALLSDRKKTQTVFVSANGSNVATLHFSRARNEGVRKIVIPREILKGKDVVLFFSTRRPLSPDSLGIRQGDFRPVSFGISRVKVCVDSAGKTNCS